MGLHKAKALGVRMEELIPTLVIIQVANGIMEPVLGMVLVAITCRDDLGEVRKTRQHVYVMRRAGQLFLSHEALEELCYVREDGHLRLKTCVTNPTWRGFSQVPPYPSVSDEQGGIGTMSYGGPTGDLPSNFSSHAINSSDPGCMGLWIGEV